VRQMYYEYDVNKLWLGAHYGNLEIHARTDARSNLAGLWRAADDQFYCGRMTFRFSDGEQSPPAGTTQFYPSHQSTTYATDRLHVSKTFFAPFGTEDQGCVYMVVLARNLTAAPCSASIEVAMHYPLFVGAEYMKLPEPGQLDKRFRTEMIDGMVVTRTVGREDEVRVLCSTAPLLESRFTDRTAQLRYDLALEPMEQREVGFCLLISDAGAGSALARGERAMMYRDVFERTEIEFGALIDRCDVATPDAVLNRAIRWAKVNMIRDQRRFPVGLGFTNDPPQDILVVRDVAWFTVGCDYFVPWFSRGSLEVVRDYGVEPGGALTEYIMASNDPPSISNYGLNINDDTPLFIFGVHHHYALTKDVDFLRGMYDTVRDAADWILAQRRDGLIWCTSEESNLWGICSWRNVIPGYQLSGAVTEINAECYMGLYLASRCAKALDRHDDAQRFLEAALALKRRINDQLVSEQTGVYLLNIDNQGVRHHDLTGDMIFPVLFGVATRELKNRVLDMLTGPKFWTDYGARTVAPGEPNYDPERSLQLLGGVWPNLTAWIAYAGREERPDMVVRAMRNIYRLSETASPAAFKNVVPGQFPERLNGTTYESCGMALSPWMPPTYLWLAMDGLVGFRPSLNRLIVQPHIPYSWRWIAVRKFPYAGKVHSLFFLDGVLYTTLDVDTVFPVLLFDEDVSGQVSSDAFCIALRRADQVTIFVSATESQDYDITIAPSLVEDGRVITVALAAGEAKLLTL
jgi:Bacterial alpha-L-rhamnosidase 6 hairpin glycosidase domain